MQKTKNILVSALIWLIIIFSIIFSKQIKTALRAGVFICLETIIPSLYFFMIISSMLMDSQFSAFCQKYLSRISKAVFRFDGKILAVFILSQLGGYPIGIRLLSQLYEDGDVNKKQAAIYSTFCFSSGPAFISGLVNCPEKFSAIMLSNTLSNLIIGIFLCRFLRVDNSCVCNIPKSQGKVSVVKSVQSAAKSLFAICSMILFMRAFLCVAQQLGIVDLISNVTHFEKDIILSIFEITHVINVPSAALSAAALSFGGICVIMQICALSGFKLNVFVFCVVRFSCAVLSFAICSEIYTEPEQMSAVSAMASAQNAKINTNVAQSLMLILMSCMLLSKNSRQIKNNVI